MRSRTPFTILAAAVLAPLAAAQSKVPRPLPPSDDVKVAAPAPVAVAPDEALAAQRTEERAVERARAPRKVSPPKLPDGAPALPARPPIDRSRVHYDENARAGELWARGAAWKMRFDADSATYVPFLGARAPRNYPITFRLESARAGGVEIPLALGAGARRDGESVVIDRGAIDEVWHLLPETAEQTFVLGARLGDGDVTLRVAYETELAARTSADGFAFENEHGGVRYGRAFAVDARGERHDLPARLEAGAIAIDVADALLDAAAFPLVVDPVVSTFAIDESTGYDDFFPDIAWLAGTNRYCVSMEDVFSGGDHDAYWYVLDANGAVMPFSGVYADLTDDSWYQPRVAANVLGNTFGMAAQVVAVGASESDIRVRTRFSSSSAQSAPQIVSTGFGGKLHADIGGDPSSTGPTYYCVVWQRHYDALDHDVHARLVTPDGFAVGSGAILIDNSGSTIDYAPNVSKTNGNEPWSTQTWNVAWTRYHVGTDQRDVLAAQLTWDGIVVTPSFTVESSGDTEWAVASPPIDAASGPRAYAVAYTTEWGTYDHDLDVRVLVGNSTVAYGGVTAMESAGTILEDQISPAIDTDGSQFLVTYLESYNGNLSDYDVYAASVWYAQGELGVGEGHVNLDYTANQSHTPRMAANGSAGASSRRAGLAWTRIASNGLGDIVGGLYDAPASVNPVYECYGDGFWGTCPCSNYSPPYSGGCASSVSALGGVLGATGNARVSQDTLRLSGANMPNSTCLYFQGTAQSTSTFGDGLRCVGGTVIRLGTRSNVNGHSEIPSPGGTPISVVGNVSGGASSIGRYQAWYRNAAAYCTASTFNLTNSLKVVWLP